MRELRRLLGSVLALVTVMAVASAAAGLPVPPACHPRDEEVSGAVLRRQIEEDWLRQAEARRRLSDGPLTTFREARGGCDGVKDGKYGFHTTLQPNPWWQVDLGEPREIARVVVYNRLDYAPGLHNADSLHVLTSDDGKTWTLRHDCAGRHFGGVRGGGPLEVLFSTDAVRARSVRLQIPSARGIFLHLDEVEVYGPGPGAPNLALHRPADQSSLSPWSTAKPLFSAVPVYPTAEFLARGQRVIAELRQAGVACAEEARRLDEVERRLAAQPAAAPEEERRALYLQARWVVRRLLFADPLLRLNRMLFVKRFTQETYPDVCLNHMPWVSRPGGDICALAAPDGRGIFQALADPDPAQPAAKLRSLLNGALGPGHVHGLDLHWNAGRVVFGYARARSSDPPQGWTDRRASYDLRRTEEPIHLFEIGTDGRGLRQITRGEWSDLDPTYAPNGDIVFVSERCGTSLQCNEYDKDETSCNLYVMRPDGSRIRRLSANKDGDYLPHALDDGTIAYTRWEYHERGFAFIQSLWFIRPDGTGADALFKQHFQNPWALEDARSIPGSRKLVAIATGHHTLAVGPLVVINPAAGINDPEGIAIVTPGSLPPEGGMSGTPVREGGVKEQGGLYATPWALSEKRFLVAATYSDRQTDATGHALYLVDVHGNKELIYRDPAISCFTPIPLRPRPTPRVYPTSVHPGRRDAVCVLSDATFGCADLERGRVRYLRIAEPVGWPYDNTHGGHRYGEHHRYAGPGSERKNLLSWTPIRVLGDVPVERDGSAHFRVPADTAVYFQLLDESHMELRRMRSFISFQPGETRACVGCHESRAIAPRPVRVGLAARRRPSVPAPPPWGDRPVSFLRDVQPVLDRRCVSCHGGLKPAGGVDLVGGLTSHDAEVAGYGYNRAYETLIEKGLVSLSNVGAQDASVTQPLAYGSLKSKLIQVLEGGAHRGRVRLTGEERLRLVTWIDANAPYHDRFVNKRAGMPPYDLPADGALLREVTAVHQRRCAGCHAPADVSRLDWVDLRDPDATRFLAAPLARAAGGTQRCASATYAGTEDPDYRALRERIRAAVRRAWEAPRRELEALAR